jgi:hypothetical protein
VVLRSRGGAKVKGFDALAWLAAILNLALVLMQNAENYTHLI